ncbi:serine hydrolase domain-containing protein [Odoribacter splanchnicus]|uniref:serine hydrolase domain-containing protein n=1 Tax=Odoribacter splanchnicus TaxID=28118 RepID=UPI0034C17C03
MTKNIRIPVVAFLLLCCNLISYAQETEHAKLDRYLRLLGDKNKFMGSVSVFSKGTEIYARSVGFADIDKQIVADAQSEYHIGSISKLFTTVMIFQAIEAGQLSLSSPIDSYFPTIKNAHKITIGHLLSHRSGIHNFTADEQYLNWNTQAKTKEQMVEIIARGGSDFEPDSKAQYSNSNFVLLSYILESLYKKPYAEILADRITRPLSLVNTHLGRKTISPEQNECNSYKYFDKWRIESVTHPSIPLGAGGIVSTPRDLNKFADALFKGKLISANSLSTMLALKDNFGMGIFPVPFYAKRGFGHSGGIDGFNAMLIYFPEDELSYAITSNALNYTFNDIHIAVLSGIYGMPFDLPNFEAITLKPEDLVKYTGVYSNSQLPIKLTVRIKNNALEGQGTGQAAFPLEAISEHTFKFTQGGIVMEFNPENRTMTLKQGGGVFLFKKE